MIRISSQDEQLLRDVVATGRFKSEADAINQALRLLLEQSAGVHDELSVVSQEQWLESFRNWSRRQRNGNPDLDDSRGSIYE